MKLKLPSYDNNDCFDRSTQNMFENKLKDGSIVGCLEMAGPYETFFLFWQTYWILTKIQ